MHRIARPLACCCLAIAAACTAAGGGAQDSAAATTVRADSLTPASVPGDPAAAPADSGASMPDGAAVLSASAPDTLLVGTTGPTSGGTALQGGLATLTDIRTAPRAQEPFERIVFQFGAGPLPRYEIAYAEPPAQQCGSGAEVPVAGSAMLRVRLRGTQAHVQSAGAMRPTLIDRDRRLDQPLLKQLTLICDFEGEVAVVLGLAVRRPYRVLELEMPTRLVVDVLGPDAGVAPR